LEGIFYQKIFQTAALVLWNSLILDLYIYAIIIWLFPIYVQYVALLMLKKQNWTSLCSSYPINGRIMASAIN